MYAIMLGMPWAASAVAGCHRQQTDCMWLQLAAARFDAVFTIADACIL
jgi:hypothetical protein